jgi:hypothetical protein
MAVFRGIGGSSWTGSGIDGRATVSHEEERRPISSGRLGTGTLACGRCDAPVAIGPDPLLITDQLMCPFCRNRGPVRDFLSLARPTRPARVEVRFRFTRSPATR